MFANTGLSYLLGIFGGGICGLNEGLKNTPSYKFKVKVNSVLNNCSRHGSRIGNVAGVLSICYSCIVACDKLLMIGGESSNSSTLRRLIRFKSSVRPNCSRSSCSTPGIFCRLKDNGFRCEIRPKVISTRRSRISRI